MFEDLIADVQAGRLSLADAEVIAAQRTRLEGAMDAEEYRVATFESDSRRRVGSQQLNVKGYGHRTLGAKGHGKSTVCTPGAGYGRYASERLHRIA